MAGAWNVPGLAHPASLLTSHPSSGSDFLEAEGEAVPPAPTGQSSGLAAAMRVVHLLAIHPNNSNAELQSGSSLLWDASPTICKL